MRAKFFSLDTDLYIYNMHSDVPLDRAREVANDLHEAMYTYLTTTVLQAMARLFELGVDDFKLNMTITPPGYSETRKEKVNIEINKPINLP
mgnify:CR=1 FL=1